MWTFPGAYPGAAGQNGYPNPGQVSPPFWPMSCGRPALCNRLESLAREHAGLLTPRVCRLCPGLPADATGECRDTVCLRKRMQSQVFACALSAIPPALSACWASSRRPQCVRLDSRLSSGHACVSVSRSFLRSDNWLRPRSLPVSLSVVPEMRTAAAPRQHILISPWRRCWQRREITASRV